MSCYQPADDEAGAGPCPPAARRETAAAAEAAGGGHGHGLRGQQQQQRAHAVRRGRVGAVHAVGTPGRVGGGHVGLRVQHARHDRVANPWNRMDRERERGSEYVQQVANQAIELTELLTYVAPAPLGADCEHEGEDVQDEHDGDDDDGRHGLARAGPTDR
jgi:hypothetical protein